MGFFSRFKGGASSPPDDKVSAWLRQQIRDSVDDPVALAQACAAFASGSGMAFGMVVSADLRARTSLRDDATAALRERLPAIPDRHCEAVFQIIEAAGLPIDVAARRAALEVSRQAAAARTATWLRDQLTEHAARGEVFALAEAAIALRGRGGMAFGMVLPAELDRAPLAMAAVEAVNAQIPQLAARDVERLHQVAQRGALALDFGDRLEQLEEERQAERDAQRAAASATEPRNEDLEREVEAHLDEDGPDGDGPAMVFADWLQAQGHPRGELIALQLRGAPIDDYLETHAATLLGPLHPHRKVHDDSGRDAFVWRRGFIYRAHLSKNDYVTDVGASIAEILELLCLHPSARYLRELALGLNGESSEAPLDDAIAILAREAPRTLRELHVGDFEYPDDTEMSWYAVGDLSPLWPRLRTQLRALIVQGGSFELGTLDLPVLEHAAFRTGGLSARSVAAIHQARWPQMTYLDIWYGHPDYGADATATDVRDLLQRTDLPALAHLGLMNAAFTDEICALLATSPLAAQLESLDLSLGTMSAEGAAALVAAAPRLSRLTELDVSRNYLDEDAIARLEAAFPQVVSDDQNDDGGDAADRYPSVGE